MPLFDLQCVECYLRIDDVLLKEYPENLRQYCADCEKETPWDVIPPRVAMHPDNMWSGVSNEHGYFTSKKQHLSYLRNNNLQRVERGLLEDVKKKSKRRVPEQNEKNAKNLEKFLSKELAGM